MLRRLFKVRVHGHRIILEAILHKHIPVFRYLSILVVINFLTPTVNVSSQKTFFMFKTSLKVSIEVSKDIGNVTRSEPFIETVQILIMLFFSFS